ncbi:hypothetical protein Agub_g3362 [Astrephomene gubernaculifera]|uniref:Uncharacterized protein n=1 Tax=Astrephomene gubernaculifera TaxID=47775 RepID=A0AAD3HJA8_9CHLO|nr:hypothetical protein Agub_g3362 [Astrephomene gubernaculifera]
MAQWSASEDEQLRKLVKEYGPKRWSIIAAKLKTKGSKQCRRRWKNHLNADLKSGGWSADEDRILMEGHRLYGNKWTEIAKMVGGRTDNAVKNRYAALCKRDMRGGGQRAPAGGGARRGARKARTYDSDAASDIDPDEDSEENEDIKRSSSSSSSREPSPPPRRTRAQAQHHAAGAAADSGAAAAAAGRSAGGAASPPRAVAAAAAAVEPAAGSSAGRSAVLGRRRTMASSGGAGGGSPPLQPELDVAAAPSKRRAVSYGGGGSVGGAAAGGAVGRLLTAPASPRTPRLLDPPQEFAAPQHNQQQQRPGIQAGRIGFSDLQQGMGTREGSEDAGVRGGSCGGAGPACALPKKLPLTINIPNAASAEPAAQPPLASATAQLYGIEIRVLKDLLTPCEIQYARELNDMQLPLHINLDDDPAALQNRNSGPMTGCLLGAGSEPPLTTSRLAAQNAVSALMSPGTSGCGGLGDFNDVLKWFQTGLTPRGPCADDGTPRLLSRLGLTPCGLGSSIRGGRGGEEEGRMLGTGLTPRFLIDGGSPLSRGGAGGPSSLLSPPLADGMPSRRMRRQIAVAAAVAASASTGPGPSPSPLPPSQQQQLEDCRPPPCGAGCSTTPGPGMGLAGGLSMTSPMGMELHAGHRQLLTKLIQSAAAAEGSVPGASGAAGGGCNGVGGSTSTQQRLDCSGLRILPPSPTGFATTTGSTPPEFQLQGGLAGQGHANACSTAGGEAGQQSYVGGVVVTPYFSQQELLMLLEVLTSDDLQALPPPPQGQTPQQEE